MTHLTRVGYHILARNVQVGPGEIDIVAEDPSGALAFIEVRSRDEEAPVRPVQTLTREKHRRIVRCGRAYMRGHHLHKVRHRYHIVEVYLGPDGRPARARLVRDAISPFRRRRR